MLSHALLETWRRRKGRMLTTAAYEAAGGLNGAIAASAETVYGRLSAPQASAARQLLLRLVEPGRGTVDTGRPLTRDELLECAHPDIPVVVELLARARLLTVDEEGVRLAHESLIGCWPRLHGWIDQDRERLRHHRQLTEAARAWLEHDRDPGTLYRGTRLARAEEVFPGHGSDLALTEAERAFLTAAFDAREAERRAAAGATRRARTLVGALSAVLAVALVAGLAAWRQHDANLLQQQQNTARRVAAVADGLRTTDPRAALLLGVAAWRMAPLPETRRALLGSLAQPEVDAFSDPASGYRSQRFLADSGRTLLSVDDSTWETWNLSTRRTTASGRLPGGEVLAAGPDARVLAISGAAGEGNGGGDGGVRLWDVEVGRWTGGRRCRRAGRASLSGRAGGVMWWGTPEPVAWSAPAGYSCGPSRTARCCSRRGGSLRRTWHPAPMTGGWPCVLPGRRRRFWRSTGDGCCGARGSGSGGVRRRLGGGVRGGRPVRRPGRRRGAGVGRTHRRPGRRTP